MMLLLPKIGTICRWLRLKLLFSLYPDSPNRFGCVNENNAFDSKYAGFSTHSKKKEKKIKASIIEKCLFSQRPVSHL